MKKIQMAFLLMILYLTFAGVLIRAEGLNVTALDVGQGLCVLLEDDGHYMLYDGGGRDTSSYVVSYLKQKGITSLDYVVASHYDEDHISGLIGALHVFSCDIVLAPDYVADSEIYQSFVNARDTASVEMIAPRQGDHFSLGNAEFTVVGPLDYNAPVENNRSIAIRIEDVNGSCLICGDAEAEEEYDILNSGYDIESDIYIVNHHGSASSSSYDFVKAIAPVAAIISCGKGNTYGHPTESALASLQDLGCGMYRTDMQNEIELHCESSGIEANQMPCEDWSPGYVEEISTETVVDETGIRYICNENTGVFHYPDCGSVAKMKEKNKRYTSQGRDELIAAGYRSCGNCHP